MTLFKQWRMYVVFVWDKEPHEFNSESLMDTDHNGNANRLSMTDYNNSEFVFEDIDGRWIAVGRKAY